MQELMSTARNVFFIAEEKTVRPMIEMVLTVSEPKFKMDPGGVFGLYRETETIRIHTDPKGLREIAERCIEWADEAEAMAKRIHIEEEGYDPDRL